MKKIEAIIRKTKFEEVKDALLEADIEWFSYYDVRGIGKSRQGRIYRGVVYDTSSIERILVSIVVRDKNAEKTVQAIIKAGTYAATGMGRQSPVIIAVTNKELRDKLSVMNAKFMGKDESFDPFYGAQELLIVLANKAMPTYLYDGTLVLGNLMNAAADLGVDSCWIHRAKEEFETQEGKELLKSLGIEGDYEGIGHLVLGYAAAPLKEAAPRKADYVYYIR